MRVVIDVNVLVRVVLGSPKAARFLHKVISAGMTVLTSDVLLHEFSSVVRKPRLAGHVDRDLYNQTLAFLGLCGELVKLTLPFPECRDPADGYLLAMARDGKADFLLTYDDDLLTLTGGNEFAIETPDEFQLRTLTE